MGLIDRQNQMVREFSSLRDWEDRYKKLISMGKELPHLPEEKKQDEFRIKGCQSQVWMHARLENGKIFFDADSDAILVRGLIALLLNVYSNSTPEEILSASPDFIKDIGLEQKLSPSRANGLLAMLKQMRFYALAFQTLLQG